MRRLFTPGWVAIYVLSLITGSLIGYALGQWLA